MARFEARRAKTTQDALLQEHETKAPLPGDAPPKDTAPGTLNPLNPRSRILTSRKPPKKQAASRRPRIQNSWTQTETKTGFRTRPQQGVNRLHGELGSIVKGYELV